MAAVDGNASCLSFAIYLKSYLWVLLRAAACCRVGFSLFLSNCPIQVQTEAFSHANNMHLAALQLPLNLLKITMIAALL